MYIPITTGYGISGASGIPLPDSAQGTYPPNGMYVEGCVIADLRAIDGDNGVGV